MIYTAHLDLTPEQRKRPSSAESARSAAACAQRFARQLTRALREVVAKSRAALADRSGFDAR